jgi:hypothetical protein
MVEQVSSVLTSPYGCQQPVAGVETSIPSTPRHGVPPVPASPLKELQRSQQQHERSRALWSPSQSRVSLNDRFIPSRSAAARLDFSVLERELVAEEVSKTAADREVRGVGRWPECVPRLRTRIVRRQPCTQTPAVAPLMGRG